MSMNSVLPVSYGDTKIALMPRDPLWMFVYWEISDSAKQYFAQKFSDDFVENSLALRVYDVTDIIFDGTNANRFFDIRVSDRLESWYINVGEFNRVWCVDLGYVLKDGGFQTITRSNVLALPRYGVCPEEDTQWASYKMFDNNFMEIIGNTSASFVNLTHKEFETEQTWGAKLDNSNLFKTPLPTSNFFAKPYRPPMKKSNAEGGDLFWLKADAEIIIYGATCPGASVTICGRPVPLEEDGSFATKFYLPDSTEHYVVEAVSSNGSYTKRILFEINKQTK